MKKALILGINGQDGALLARHLLDLGYEVYGGARVYNEFTSWRLVELDIYEKVNKYIYNIGDKAELENIIMKSSPSEIYLLAGNSKTNDSYNKPSTVVMEGITATAELLDICLVISPTIKIFLAGSSEMFGIGPSKTQTQLCDELSYCLPNNPYGLNKLAIFHLARQYRIVHNIFVNVGILFNHESSLRQKYFITRKITSNLARLKIQGGPPFTIGNLDSRRDWSSAEDVVTAMHLTMQQNTSSDYIISSGKSFSVRDFLSKACLAAGFTPKYEGSGINEFCFCEKTGIKIAQVNMKHYRIIDTPELIGNNTNITEKLGWEPKLAFNEMILEMVAKDIERYLNNNYIH